MLKANIVASAGVESWYRNRPNFGHYPNFGHFWLFFTFCTITSRCVTISMMLKWLKILKDKLLVIANRCPSSKDGRKLHLFLAPQTSQTFQKIPIHSQYITIYSPIHYNTYTHIALTIHSQHTH